MRHHPPTLLRGGKANKSSVWDQKETDFIWNTPRKWLDSLVILNQHCNFQDQRVPTVLHPLISKVNFLTHEAEKLHAQLAMNGHVSKKTLPGKYSGAASINAASCLQPRCPISPLENLATAPLTSLTGVRVEAGGATRRVPHPVSDSRPLQAEKPLLQSRRSLRKGAEDAHGRWG